MITSARGCIDEPKIYGPFRLIDSMIKLYLTLKKNNIFLNSDIEDIIAKIEDNRQILFSDEEAVARLLDDVIDDFVNLVK